MGFKEHLFWVSLAVLASVGGTSAARSADFGPAPAPVAPASQWRLSFTPYGWLTWLDGEQTVRGRSVDVKVDPIQVLDHLERVPFFGYGEARNGPTRSLQRHLLRKPWAQRRWHQITQPGARNHRHSECCGWS